jgi:hypothetical protein
MDSFWNGKAPQLDHIRSIAVQKLYVGDRS